MRYILSVLFTLCVLAASVTAAAPQKLRFLWEPVPDAVRYQFVVTQGDAADAPVVYTDDYVYNNGYELAVFHEGLMDGNHFYRVCPLGIDGQAVGSFSAPRALGTGAQDTTSPLPTSEENADGYALLYPVYSWIKTWEAASYEVAVWYRNPETKENDLVHLLYAENLTLYDYAGFTCPGDYFWRVRSLDAQKQPIGTWSEPVAFRVTTPTPIAAIGDGIVHGGGAIVHGPDRTMYDWESYAAFPIKNLGHTGDTVADVMERFDRDVLPISPRVLIIQAGGEDARRGASSREIVDGLTVVRDRTKAHGITPVFLTIPPIRPSATARTGLSERPAGSWDATRREVNAWLLTQEFVVDVDTALTDGEGLLRADMTTDGVQVDASGKAYIGERVKDYLVRTFPKLADLLPKN